MGSERNSKKITVNKKCILLGYAIQEILVKEELHDAKPKDLMNKLIEKGFFNKDNREGKPLRDTLRSLDDRNELYFIPQVRVDRKEKNRLWYFNPVKL